MKFDFTHGKKAKYMVSVHRWDVDDEMRYHYYKDAKMQFDELKSKEWNEKTSLRFYDVRNDKRIRLY